MERSAPVGGQRLRWLAAGGAFSLLAVTAAVVVPRIGAGPGYAYATSSPTGSIPATSSVDGTGAATYSIDVQVPPGTAGVAPELRIDYESRRDNGYLGSGWGLSGISAITRCGATYRFDGFTAGVRYDARDRFCLDGKRLMAVTGTYGADGTTYRTETDTWTVLTSHGTCGAGPCTFTATDRDGHRLSFAAAVPAQGRTDGAIRTWGSDAFTDLNGNTATVVYAVDAAAGEYYPTRVDYTSNPGAGLEAGRSVVFGYDPRPDVVRRYLGGGQIQISRLLTSITTKVGDDPVLTYQLGYEQSAATGRSRLVDVTQCDAAGVCWPPTTFTWYTAGNGFGPEATRLPGPAYVVLDGAVFPLGLLQDVDGDGIADYTVGTEFVASGQRDLAVWLGRADGSFVKSAFSLPAPVFRADTTSVMRTGDLVDVDGDGVLDFTRGLRNADDGTVDLAVWRGTRTGFVKDPTYLLPEELYLQVDGRTLATGTLTDLNGDGLVDYSRATLVLATGERKLRIWAGTGKGFTDTGADLPGPLFRLDATGSAEAGVLRDLTGDGIPDYSAATVNADSGGSDLKVYAGSTPGFAYTHRFDLPDRMIWLVDGKPLDSGVLVDVNGDEIPDYSRATRLEAEGKELLDVHLGTGAGYVPAGWKLPGPVYSIDGTTSTVQGLLTDWNGDGTTRYSRATRFADGRTDLRLYVGGGAGFAETGAPLPQPLFRIQDNATFPDAIYQDLNGDGRTDLADAVCTLGAEGGFTNCSLGVQLGDGPFSDLLAGAHNGFGGTTTFEYAPLTAPGVYGGFTPGYPVRGVGGPMQVVTRSTAADGRGGTYPTTYRYSGGRTDVLGLGWLGFLDVTSTQVATGRTTSTAYEPAFPFYGLVADREVAAADGTPLTRTDYTYADVASPDLQRLEVHQPLPTAETYTHYTGGKADYTLRKEYAYDSYASLRLTADLGDVTDPGDDLFLCTSYRNDPAAGRYGYVDQEKTTRTRAACDPFVPAWNPATDLEWSKTAYDARMNVVGESRYDDSNAAFVTDSYERDAYGNVVAATNAAGATTTFAYDGSATFPVRRTSPELRRGTSTYQLVTRTVHEPAFGLLVSTTDPNGVTTTQQVDGFGRITSVTGPGPSGTDVTLVTSSWQTTGAAYYLETRTRPAWNVGDPSQWYWERDYRDGLDRDYASERKALDGDEPAVVVTSTTYDAAGRVATATDPYYQGDPAPTTTFTYDTYDRPVLKTDPAGVRQLTEYADGGLTIRRTEAYGTPVATTDVTTVDVHGRVVRTAEPGGLVTTSAYDPLGRLMTRTAAPLPRTSAYTYDSISRTRTETATDTGRRTWTYDPAGLLRAVTDASGNTTAYPEYDPLGRLRRRTMTYGGATATAVLTYDETGAANGLGNLTGVDLTAPVIGAFSYDYAYTAFGEPSAGSATIAGDTYSYASSYDPLGRVTAATYPDGSVLEMGYRADEHLGSLALRGPGDRDARTVATYSAYTALGHVEAATYDEPGLSVSASYFPVGTSYGLERTTAVSKGGTALLSRSYTWNPLRALTGVADAVSPQRSETYTYATDGSGYLAKATGPYGTVDYGYDTIGNLTRAGGTTLTRVPGTDRLASSSTGETFTYAPNGTLTSRTSPAGTTTFGYDAQNSLVSVTDGTRSGAAAYDHMGRQVFEQRLGETTRTYRVTDHFEVVDLGGGRFQHTVHVPGPDGPIAAVTSAGKGNVPPPAAGRHRLPPAPVGAAAVTLLALFATRRRTAIALLAVAVVVSGGSQPARADLAPGANGRGIPVIGTRYFVTDVRASTVLVTDETGAVTATVGYEPYGAVEQPASSGVDDFRPKYVGRELDPGTGLYRLGARQYAPGLGVFTSPDPAGQYASPYAYAGNDPVTSADPDGEFAFVVAIIIGAIIGAYIGGAAVNHDPNPLHWDWSSGKTYAGLLGGAAIGAVGAAAGGLAVEAGVAVGAAGGFAAEAAGVAIGITGQALVGAGENAAFAALGGGSAKDVIEAAAVGAASGAVLAAAGELAGAGAAVTRRAGQAAEEPVAASEGSAGVARRESEVLDEGADACGASFVHGTPVLGGDGRPRSIEQVRPGDRVTGREMTAAAAAAYEVGALRERVVTEVVRVTFETGSSVTTTPEHPFKLHDRGWVRAADLRAGDPATRVDGTPLPVAKVEHVAVPGGVRVRNFVVDVAENYFVGDDRVLVHNPKPNWVCRARIDNKGVVTEEWHDAELRRRFPVKATYQAMKRDIRYKARMANKIISGGIVKAMTRVKNPVKTASKGWVTMAWKAAFGQASSPPDRIRTALAILRKHPGSQDVDEFLTRIQGGLTIREGMPQNQGPLNSFVNQTSGAAMGALSRAVPPQPITAIRPAFV